MIEPIPRKPAGNPRREAIRKQARKPRPVATGKQTGKPRRHASDWAVSTLVIVGVAIAGMVEIYSWWTLTTELEPGRKVVSYALLHCGSCLMLAVGLQSSLPVQYRHPQEQNLLLFFSIAYFVPYLGPLGISVCSFYALRNPSPEETVDWVLWPEPSLPVSPKLTSSKHLRRRGAMFEILQNSDDRDKRVNAVIATRHMRDRDSVPVLRIALKDMEDEVRLQAYSFLDRKEKAISSRIKVLLELLETAEDDVVPALHRMVALNYWELVYAEMVQGNIRSHILEMALEHAEKALGSRDTRAGLEFLLGRIRLQQGRTDEALDRFQSACSNGIPESKLAPYMAEAAYMDRDFERIAPSLRCVQSTAQRDELLASLAEYWCSPPGESRVHRAGLQGKG